LGLLGLILLLPLPEGLTPQGRSALVLLAFRPALWLTEAVSHEVSAILIAWLTALVLGLRADRASPQGAVLGTARALGAALQGFANPALALLAGPLFIAAVMTMTGLARRIALLVLIRPGSGARGILAGVILVSAILSFVVPSAPGRMAALVPIILGILAAVGLERRSRFGGFLMIAAADAASIWNIGLKTAAPQNIVGLGSGAREKIRQALSALGWREAQARVAWGTIVLLGVAISLGTVLLRSGAAAWLAGNTFGAVGWAA